MGAPNPLAKAHLTYSLLCDDIRLEAGNKLSVMGIFQNIYLHTLPSTILKFALLNHWEGSGEHTTEIKIISPDRSAVVANTAPSVFPLMAADLPTILRSSVMSHLVKRELISFKSTWIILWYEKCISTFWCLNPCRMPV